jgi:hypothetical protein
VRTASGGMTPTGTTSSTSAVTQSAAMAMSWLKFVAASLWVRLSAGPRHELSYEHVAYDDGIAPKAADPGIIPTRLDVDTPIRGGKAIAHQRSAGSGVCQPFGGLV